MRFLNGAELAGFIKERQAHQVRALRQADGIFPSLHILVLKDDPTIQLYTRLKQSYGEDILVDVRLHATNEATAPELLATLNADAAVHGIIVQLPINDPGKTQEICDAIAPVKDVDGLGANAGYSSATATAVMWLLSGYGIELRGKKIVLVGKGKLVGAPLAGMLRQSGIEPVVADSKTDLATTLADADIVISATGKPNLITPSMLKENAVVVDAGTASEDGATVGDVDIAVYDRQDLTITPQKGGVGPLTVAALFDNVILAAKATIE